MSSETQTQIDDNRNAEPKASASEAKIDWVRLIGFILSLKIADKILGNWLAMHWAYGTSLLIVGLASFPLRVKQHRAYGFGQWSLFVLLFSAGATLLLYVLS